MSYFGLPYTHAVFDVAAWLASMTVFWFTTRRLLPTCRCHRFNFCLGNVERSCVHFVTSDGKIIPVRHLQHLLSIGRAPPETRG